MLTLLLDDDSSVASSTVFSPSLPPVAPRLGRAFAEATRCGPYAVADLQSAVVAFVARLKSGGLPPERVILALKAALVKYGGLETQPSLYRDEGFRTSDPRPALYDWVFRWCVDAYYDPTV